MRRSADRSLPRIVFAATAIQIVYFAIMPGFTGVWALVAALGFMLGAFGQIPINDFMIVKLASGPARCAHLRRPLCAGLYRARGFLPVIALVHEHYGFDALFQLMAGAVVMIFIVTPCLPSPTASPAAAAI